MSSAGFLTGWRGCDSGRQNLDQCILELVKNNLQNKNIIILLFFSREDSEQTSEILYH